jgi:hypothetical protein
MLQEMSKMIIPLDENCNWSIDVYTDHVEISRHNRCVSMEECSWSSMTTTERESVCNRLIKDAMKEYADVPDVSKRPICFEV